MTATGKTSADDEVKCAIFLHLAGPDALEVFNTLTFATAGDDKKLDKVMEKFEGYCKPRKNITWERHIFNSRNQKPGETIDEYVTDLRSKAKSCEFGDITESLIRDRLVCGIISDKTRSRLLKKAELTLKDALDTCRADETTTSQMKQITAAAACQAIEPIDKDVAVVKHTPRRGPVKSQPLSGPSKLKQCGYCGNRHHFQQGCPAYGVTCRKCGRQNHFAKVCRSKTQATQPQVQELDQDESSEDDMIIDAVDSGTKKNWNVTVTINKQPVQFKIDTGAQCNVISSQTYHQLSQTPPQTSKARLVAFGGNRMNPIGKTTLLCTYKEKFWPVEFEVVDNVSNILGLHSCSEMHMVKRIETLTTDPLKKYADTFVGLGCITGVTHHIKLDQDAMPVIHPPRKVPVTLRDKVKKELERMERLDVIERVREPTDWVNAMVTVVKKNGQLRICLDPRDLNKSVKREHYPMKTVEEIAARMPNAKYFSVLDASSGFWQIKLDPESSKLCTFNTPSGRYMFKRLPFGISSAQDVFQTCMSEIFEDTEGVEVVVDDILVWGIDEKQHDMRLEKVLQRARSRNLKLNKEKSQIKQRQVTYLGHILSEERIKPDPKKIQAITDMKSPTNKEELQRFLGMVTYLSKFIPHFSEMSTPLRILLEKNTEWHWDTQQAQAFGHLKDMVTSHPTLSYFDPTKPTKISADASSHGMGAVLLQDDHPIAYASRSLTPAQKNYAQIEKEMLAIVFGCNKFHDHIYGLPTVSIETDHKPLESILRKPIHAAPARLQRMILSIQKYAIHVSYRPGKELLIADTLSRAPLPELADDLTYEEYDINILHTLPISEKKLEEFKQSTKADPSLSILVRTVQEGWPKSKTKVPTAARPYWNFRDEITYHHGILFKGSRVIVPQSMQPSMLKLIHSSHLGIDRCKRRAREIVFWIGMNAQIEDTITNCTTCTTHKRSNPKEPLLPHPIPERPWERVGADLCEFEGDNYLVIADYYSNFFEVDKLRQTTSNAIIKACKAHFARHGIPNFVVSDNGPQFSSYEFEQFATLYQFSHQPSSPHYPQSNGKVEKAVQTVKNLLRKSKDENQDFYLALLEFRNTPTSTTLGSPAQRLMGRRTRTLIPASKKLLLPNSPSPSVVRAELAKERDRQKYQYDKHSHPLSTLKKGDKVTFQRGHKWLPATVTAATQHPRSYIITTPNGQSYRRNRRHLRPDPTNSVRRTSYDSTSPSDDEDDEPEPGQTQHQEREPEEQAQPDNIAEHAVTRRPETPPLRPRRSQRNVPRPYSYADPYTLRFDN